MIYKDNIQNNFLELRNINKSFGLTKIIKNFNLIIKKGEFFVFLGPSGSGKTTLLRIIAGLEFPEQGKILLNNQNITNDPANKRKTNMVFQSYALFPNMTVQENISYGLKIAKKPLKQINCKVRKILKQVAMSEFYNRMPSSLSGGQKQRVAVARALIMQPDILLLDEPLSALDNKLRESMQEELIKLQKDIGITFIMVTHNQEEALSIADRIALINHGKIEQIDSPRKLYQNPANDFVARFIGKANIIDACILTKTLKHLEIQIIGIGNITLLKINQDNLFIGEKLICIIRPENIYIKKITEKGKNFDFSLLGTIVQIKYYGSDSYIKIKINSHNEYNKSFTLWGITNDLKNDFKLGNKILAYISMQKKIIFNKAQKSLIL